MHVNTVSFWFFISFSTTEKLAGSNYFTSLDLRSGYWQILIDPPDIKKTAFITRQGQFEWKVLTFGFCNAPSTFQRVMNQAFKGLLDKGVVVYLDDILIYSKTLHEHQRLVRQALQVLRKFRFYAKLKKCQFYQRAITFLGH